MNRTALSLRSRHDGRTGGQTTRTDSGSRPNRASRRGGHRDVVGLTAQLKHGLPSLRSPKSPCPGAPDANSAPGHHRRSPRRAVSSPEVMGGGDEPPFGSDGGSAASVEATHAAVVFGVAEDGLDHRLAATVEA